LKERDRITLLDPNRKCSPSTRQQPFVEPRDAAKAETPAVLPRQRRDPIDHAGGERLENEGHAEFAVQVVEPDVDFVQPRHPCPVRRGVERVAGFEQCDGARPTRDQRDELRQLCGAAEHRQHQVARAGVDRLVDFRRAAGVQRVDAHDQLGVRHGAAHPRHVLRLVVRDEGAQPALTRVFAVPLQIDHDARHAATHRERGKVGVVGDLDEVHAHQAARRGRPKV
jgi:hypothetical protein